MFEINTKTSLSKLGAYIVNLDGEKCCKFMCTNCKSITAFISLLSGGNKVICGL